MSDNELIAEFMGRSYGKNSDKNGFLSYATSWDWLMPVVEKIESMKTNVSIIGGHCDIWNYYDPKEIIRGNSGVNKYKKRSSGESKIEATHKAVVEFIKWYNSNK